MIMKRSTGAVLTAVCVGVGAAVVVPVALSAPIPECTAGDDRLAASPAALGILDAHPADATPQGGRGSGCDGFSGTVIVGQSYYTSALVADVFSFYRGAAIMDGWKPGPADEGEGVSCFTRSVGGREVRLSVGFLETGKKDGDDYDVNVSSSVDGGSRC
ncbi:hypothetical protein GCM10017673_45610 [Streptosporangium violaceochromogenes]|nr:hypothetical protein GCM10017673_45610 [Streptosporangium violaceochromogenes]